MFAKLGAKVVVVEFAAKMLQMLDKDLQAAKRGQTRRVWGCLLFEGTTFFLVLKGSQKDNHHSSKRMSLE